MPEAQAGSFFLQPLAKKAIDERGKLFPFTLHCLDHFRIEGDIFPHRPAFVFLRVAVSTVTFGHETMSGGASKKQVDNFLFMCINKPWKDTVKQTGS